ncbi:MAG TPA: RDD family protein [Bryobacteraceae bacterium]|nr:RDD family protein [Bryobacteraceae bacterium]
MSWYYADGGRQVGPVEESALDELVKAGAVRDDTLVWREGMPNWQPHAAVRGVKVEAPPMPAVQAGPGTGFCSECGRPFATDQLLNLGTASVCAQCKPIYLQRVREGGQAIGLRRYAGFWIRFVAAVIDGIILSVVGFVITIPLRAMAIFRIVNDPAAALGAGLGIFGILVLINMGLSLAYNAYFVSTRGATLGKQVLGLKIIRSDGSAVSPGRAVGRYFAWLLSNFTFLIGFIIAGFDSEKRALHDHIVDTRVIYTR